MLGLEFRLTWIRVGTLGHIMGIDLTEKSVQHFKFLQASVFVFFMCVYGGGGGGACTRVYVCVYICYVCFNTSYNKGLICLYKCSNSRPIRGSLSHSFSLSVLVCHIKHIKAALQSNQKINFNTSLVGSRHPEGNRLLLRISSSFKLLGQVSCWSSDIWKKNEKKKDIYIHTHTLTLNQDYTKAKGKKNSLID